MDKLVAIDSNPSFRAMFLRFEGADNINLLADREEDFHRWMDAFSAYDTSRQTVQPEMSLEAAIEAAWQSGRLTEEALTEEARISHDRRSHSPGKRESGRASARQSSKGSSTTAASRGESPEHNWNHQAVYRQCYVMEPHPEPVSSPGFHQIYQQVKRIAQEEYDPGDAECKAVLPSMGIIDHTLGLTPRLSSPLAGDNSSLVSSGDL
jgi:hypothetical protein